ncbi:universal stress protein [Arsenicitalea aurantiaca]|uniref:Universal stress protein n=1 Tax=Arsenicitalea aurantiaca TaxID=1783274 RepID=A0A433XLV3_9HYPH|nr:universal stress protein [Arsenicitalea aurantiaca]RUT35062.1 universal stress protein [Arsenicitalea aurantiaca]
MQTDIFMPVLTYPDPTALAAVGQMIGLVSPLASAISVCAFEIDLPAPPARMVSGLVDVKGMSAAAEGRSRAVAADLIAAARAAGASVPVTTGSVRLTQDQVGNGAARMARSHDLSVIAMDRGSADKAGLAETVIFGSGRPVLLVPEGPAGSADLRSIAIAWDGGRAASRALHDAMPLIVQAREVTLVTAMEDKDIGERAIAEVRAYLGRHGISAGHHDFSSAGKSIGLALQQGAIAQNAGLLVMGAFGHSRLRDFVLGGATRSTLDDLRLPVLLSH